MNVVGRWMQRPPAHFDEGELRSREGTPGTGNLRVRAAIGLEQDHDNVNGTVLETAQPLWLGNCKSRNTARAGGPHQGRDTPPAPLCNLGVNLSACLNRSPVAGRQRERRVVGSRERHSVMSAPKVFGFREVAPLKQPPTSAWRPTSCPIPFTSQGLRTFGPRPASRRSLRREIGSSARLHATRSPGPAPSPPARGRRTPGTSH